MLKLVTSMYILPLSLSLSVSFLLLIYFLHFHHLKIHYGKLISLEDSITGHSNVISLLSVVSFRIIFEKEKNIQKLQNAL